MSLRQVCFCQGFGLSLVRKTSTISKTSVAQKTILAHQKCIRREAMLRAASSECISNIKRVEQSQNSTFARNSITRAPWLGDCALKLGEIPPTPKLGFCTDGEKPL
jgi:hypothetical protein